MEENKVAIDTSHGEELCKLFIGNVNKTTIDEDFTQYFEKYGYMKEITLKKDNINISQNRGYGFVTTGAVEIADKILMEPIHQLDGRELDIKRAFPKEIEDPLLHVKTSRIFLGGLPHNISEEEITIFFNDRYIGMGSVKEVVIKKERTTGRPRGFCFISFDNPHVVDKIMIELRFPVINNKRCEVRKADPAIPITGAPPSQLTKYSNRPPHRDQQYYRAPNVQPTVPYEYNGYPTNPSVVGYPQSNAYYSYYQNQASTYPTNPYGNQGVTPNYGGMYSYPDRATRPPRPNYSQNDRTRPY